ncbi:MAG: apolipoprotein N-acyltransferase [Eubacteriales bacterium]|nr:apolipoprotein N-acyltransferase [Eubacteriales bacterium]
MKCIRIPRFIICIISGFLASLPLIYEELFFVAFISYIPFVYIALCECTDMYNSFALRRRHVYLHLYSFAFFFFMGYYLGAYHWFLALRSLDIGATDGSSALAVTYIAWIGLSLFQSIFYAFFLPLWRLVCVRLRHFSLQVTAFISLFCFFDYLQTLTWAGVPWASPAIGLYRHPYLIQSASLFGSHFLVGVIISVNVLLAYAIFGLRRIYSVHMMRTGLVFALAVFMINLCAGAIIYHVPMSAESEDNRIRISVLQANISSLEKWTTANASFLSYKNMTEEICKKENPPDIVIWPETAIPTSLDPKRGYYKNEVSKLARDTNATIIVGAFFDDYSDMENVKEYTSLFIFYPDGSLGDTVYSKRKLVPFGEFVPYESLIEKVAPPLAELTMSALKLDIGTQANPFDTDMGKIGSLICFDTVYPSIVRESVLAGSEVMIVSTNDSWFLDSRAIYQHHAHSVLRAVENGRYFAVSANTGISAIINPKGKIVSETLPLVSDSLTEDIYTVNSNTLYSVVGDVFILLCILYLTVLAVIGYAFPIIKKSKRKNDK